MLKGLDTNVGENYRLSGGQLQRLGIARVFKVDIIILDEFTSALDKENEMKF